MADTVIHDQKNKTLAYLSGFLMMVFPIAGVIIAYIDRNKASDLVSSHYKWYIGTFWKGLLFSFVSMILMFFIIGFFTMIITGVWYLIRVIRSLILLSRDEPIRNPSGWWI